MQKDNQENGLFKPFPEWKMLVLPGAETCEGNQGDTRFREDAIVVERERERIGCGGCLGILTAVGPVPPLSRGDTHESGLFS